MLVCTNVILKPSQRGNNTSDDEIWIDNVSLQPFTDKEWSSHQVADHVPYQCYNDSFYKHSTVFLTIPCPKQVKDSQ
ncbi:hypothetical protein LR48_Vigan10g023500 [Vigna angularis]|uniref:Uncharacterized protein n=1 Tax=Phaseolus angularis TaxID=3914 RepID=A0A0L9VH76_PHAAN|nr:hypothetical protein LR48_Vigan10g023500 [Vigna angularis]